MEIKAILDGQMDMEGWVDEWLSEYFVFTKMLQIERATRSPSPGASISHANPMKQALHVSFYFLETMGLLDSRTLYAIQYNIIQYDTAQHNSTQQNTIQCTILYAVLGI